MTSYLSHLVYTGSHEKRETRMGTSGYDVHDVYLWILICVYSVVSHPCVIISMLKCGSFADQSEMRMRADPKRNARRSVPEMRIT